MHEREIRHGYGHDPDSSPHDEVEGSFAYHLRRYRQWYGKSGISLRTLAMIAHVSRHRVEEMEASPKLQGRAETLIRIALALRRPVEELISPERYRALQAEIEGRRSHLGGAAELPAEPKPKGTDYHLAVAYRSPYLLMALSHGKNILQFRQRRAAMVKTCLRFRAMIEEEAKAYDVREIIVEADTKTADYVYSLGIPHRVLSFAKAKGYLMPSHLGTPPSNKTFFQALIERHPELARFVKILSGTGRVAMTDHWRTDRLTVAALALAESAATPGRPPKPVIGALSGPRRQPRRREARTGSDPSSDSSSALSL
jgi:transcriptional regulator with XRE-family HTH domain